MTIPLQFASLYDRQIFVWSNCLLDLGTDFLVGNMVFACNVSYLAVAPHFHDAIMTRVKDEQHKELWVSPAEGALERTGLSRLDVRHIR